MDGVELRVPGDAPAVKKKGISGSTVKIVAIITMFIDHIGAVLLARELMVQGIRELATGNDAAKMIQWLTDHAALYYGYTAIRAIGRVGFPIFCFLLVEGFHRTRDVKKYAMRMALFALISEIPFNLALTGKVMEFGYQNVYFTLFLGLFALCAYDFFAKYRQSSPDSGLWMIPVVLGVVFTAMYGLIYVNTLVVIRASENSLLILVVLCVIVSVCLGIYGRKRGIKRVQVVGADMTVLILIMFLADFLRTDYGGIGVLTITAIYVFRKNKKMAITAGCAVLTIMSIAEITSFFALIPIALYNGKRGLKMKYFFYVFYPAHLLLLYLIALLLGLGTVAAV